MRPFNGSCSICVRFTTPPTVDCAVSTAIVPAVTSTFSLTAPTAIEASTRAVCPTSTTTWGVTKSANPLAVIFSRYSPGFSVGMTKYPLSSELAVRVAPVDTEVAVTFAPRTSAPVESVTTPEMPPTGACAKAGAMPNIVRIAVVTSKWRGARPSEMWIFTSRLSTLAAGCQAGRDEREDA